MKKIALTLFLGSLFFITPTWAATPQCSSYMYGYDGTDVYLRLNKHVYGPFASVADLKATFERFGPSFQKAISEYILADPDANAKKELVLTSDITQCLPYKITRAAYGHLSMQITKLFRTIHFRYIKDAAGELAYFKARKTQLDTYIASAPTGADKVKAQIFADRLTSHLWYLDAQKRTAEAAAIKAATKKK